MKYFKSIMALCALAIIGSAIAFLFMKKNVTTVGPQLPAGGLNTVEKDIKAAMWDNYVPQIIEDDYKQIPSKTSFTDTTNKKFTIDDITEKKYKLVVRYSYIDCDLCVNQVMKQLKAESEKQSIKDAVAITNSASDRDFLIRSKETQFPIKVYNVTDGNIGLYMENKNFPFLFVLTPDNRAIKIFTPAKENVEQIKLYLKKVLNFVNVSNQNIKI